MSLTQKLALSFLGVPSISFIYYVHEERLLVLCVPYVVELGLTNNKVVAVFVCASFFSLPLIIGFGGGTMNGHLPHTHTLSLSLSQTQYFCYMTKQMKRGGIYVVHCFLYLGFIHWHLSYTPLLYYYSLVPTPPLSLSLAFGWLAWLLLQDHFYLFHN